jgi:hypothetical protein
MKMLSVRSGAVTALVLLALPLVAQNPSNPIQVALLRWYGVNSVAQFSGDGGCTTPGGPAFDGAHVWVACKGANQIEELNASDGKWLATVTGITTPVNLLYDGANIWATNGNTTSGTVYKVNVAKVNGTPPCTSGPACVTSFTVGSGPWGLAFDGTYVWVSNYNSNDMYKVPQSGSPIHVPLTNCMLPLGVAFDKQFIWVACTNSGTVQQLTAAGGQNHAPITMGTGANSPFQLAFDGTNLWVSCTVGTQLRWVNTTTYTVPSPITVAAGCSDVVFDGRYVWVLDGSGTGGSVTKVLASSPSTPVPGNPFTIGVDPGGETFDGGNLWVTGQGTNTISKF